VEVIRKDPELNRIVGDITAPTLPKSLNLQLTIGLR
jgi:hypothetical protein